MNKQDMNKNKNKNKEKTNVSSRSARMSRMSSNPLNSLGSSVFALKQVSSNVKVIAEGLEIYFKSDDNRREKKIDIDLPDNIFQFAKVTLNFALRCPSNKCDAWDRLGTFGILDEEERYLELFRFITPYGIGAKWTADLSDFLPLLEGIKTFRIFIDTWVGPGHPQGNGWLVDASLHYEEGDPNTRALFVYPFLRMENIVYGDPKQSTKRKVEVTLKNIPRSNNARLYTIITGHGQGNAENCAEFCPKNHTISFAGSTASKIIWRDDCATSVDPNQKGNYRSSRAGWCPGDKVYPWIIDINIAKLSSDFAEFKYDVDPYINTCRPDAVKCQGCVFGTPCSYDGGIHTEPRYYVSSYLIYRA